MKIILAALLVLLSIPALANDEPSFSILRYEDSFEHFEDPNAPDTALDKIKRIPLPGIPESYISFGGEVRLRYDFEHNPEWGESEQDDWGAFLQRYLLHTNIEFGPHVRLFGELRSTWENGREAPTSPVEEGKLDVQQGFLELEGDLPWHGLSGAARVGRQELLFGSQRLIAIREGPNNRRRFDAVRLDLGNERIHSSGIAGYPVRDEPGVFEDETNDDVALWGLYNTARAPFDLPTNVDFYYLGYWARERTYVQGTGRERRHSIGTRIFGARDGLDWNWEGVLQWGKFGSGDILAWTVATDTGYRCECLPLHPRIALNANVASGDRDPDDDDLETFNPLFPRGNYFSHLALLGPRNFVNLHPGIELEVLENLAVGLDASFYWRLSTNDGIYGPAGNTLRTGTDVDDRFVGTALSGSIDWDINRFVFFGIVYTHVFPGDYIRATGEAKDIDFIELTLKVRF